MTLPPIDKETRPPPIVDEDKLRSYDGVSAGFLGSKKILFNCHQLVLIASFRVSFAPRYSANHSPASHSHGNSHLPTSIASQGRISYARGQRRRRCHGSRRGCRSRHHRTSRHQEEGMVHLNSPEILPRAASLPTFYISSSSSQLFKHKKRKKNLFHVIS